MQHCIADEIKIIEERRRERLYHFGQRPVREAASAEASARHLTAPSSGPS